MIDGKVAVTATDASLSGTYVGLGANNASSVTSFDDIKAFTAHGVVNAHGRIADDPEGWFNGTTLQAGSVFWLSPLNDFANQPAPTAYDGGSWYLNVHATYVGADDVGFEVFNATSGALETGTWTYTSTGTAGVAPTLAGIPDFECDAGTDPGPWDLTPYETTGEPAPTYALTSGSLSGRVLSPAGVITGACTSTAGTNAATVTATNATSGDPDTFDITVNAIVEPPEDPPVCTNIPEQRYVVDAGINLNLAQYCTGSITYASGAVPEGVQLNGAVFSGVAQLDSAGNSQHPVTTMQASNLGGTTNVDIAWHITSASGACDRVARPSGPSAVRSVVRSITCAP
jgi:hypothetical protein